MPNACLSTFLVALPSLDHLLVRLETAERERLATLVAIRREADRLRRNAAEPDLEVVASHAAAELGELVDAAQADLDATGALIASRHSLLRHVA